MKKYIKPTVSMSKACPGLPTVLAVGLASAAVGAAAVAVSKMVGDDKNMYKNKTLVNIKGA